MRFITSMWWTPGNSVSRIVLTTTKWQVDVWFAAALYGCETEGSVAGDGTVK